MKVGLGGFHFNDRRYADDDLIVGSQNPFELFCIFNEIVGAQVEGQRLCRSHRVHDRPIAQHRAEDRSDDTERPQHPDSLRQSAAWWTDLPCALPRRTGMCWERIASSRRRMRRMCVRCWLRFAFTRDVIPIPLRRSARVDTPSAWRTSGLPAHDVSGYPGA